jgi:lysophospholipase L1-like esterase
MGPAARRILYPFWLLLSVAGLLGLLELLASTAVDKPASHVVTSWRVNHTWKPGGRSLHREWVARNPRFPEPYTHTYNRQGWIEDYDVSQEKPEGTWRVFYVGDSFVEGTAPMHQSLPSRVEEGLNARAPDSGPRVEVINTGTSSYSPLIHYVLIRHVLLDYDPDLIIVVVDMTDDYDDWKYRATAIFDGEGNPWAVPPRDLYAAPFLDTRSGPVIATPTTKLQLFLFRHSSLFNLLLERRAAERSPSAASSAPARPAAMYPRWAWCEEEWGDATRQNAGRSLDVLRRIAVLARERGVALMLTSVPHYQQYAGGRDGSEPPPWSSRPHAEIARVAAENDVPFLDAFEALAPVIRGTPQDRYYYRGDMHFNPDGYALWADAHLAFLTEKRNGLLPPDFWPD